jgi:hypothetical protein
VSTRKIRTLLATSAAAIAVAVVPASSQALKAQPTGDPALDNYCAQAAALIDHALTESNLALINGDDEGSRAWDALAIEMIQRSRARGCEFTTARKIRRLLRDARVHLDGQTKPGISLGDGGTMPTRSLDSGAAPVSGSMAP